jgi:hypothetical protein
MDVVTGAYREKVSTFGEERGLVGILTVPAGERAVGVPHVLLLNSGILHRVGTNRLHVTLARRLAAVGITTLRFDLSGIGDSERRREVLSLRESVERDIADAIQYLSAVQGAGGVVLMGLCSGAYDSMHAALSEPRVVGAVLVDIPGPFRTWRHIAHHLGARLFRLASWRRPLEKAAHYGRALVRPHGAPYSAAGAAVEGGYFVGARSTAPRQLMAGQLATLLDRGVRLLVIFTSGVETNYNHRSQFRTTFPKAAAHPSLSFDYFEEANHAFGRRADRARLVETVVSWMQRQPFEAVPDGQLDAVEYDRHEVG